MRIPLGSTHLGLEASDVAVLVVAALALREGLRVGGRVLNHHLTKRKHGPQVIESGGAFIGR